MLRADKKWVFVHWIKCLGGISTYANSFVFGGGGGVVVIAGNTKFNLVHYLK